MDTLIHIENIFRQQSKDNHTYPASVLLAITKEENPRLLLSRRAAHLHSHAGEIALPGGKREISDTNNASVALRETYEETGIHPSSVQLLGELPVQTTTRGVQVKPIVGFVEPNVTLIPEKGEVARLFWINLTDLTEDNIVPYIITYQKMTLKTSSFQLEDEIIWGLTGRILVTFINHVFDKNMTWPMLIKD